MENLRENILLYSWDPYSEKIMGNY